MGDEEAVASSSTTQYLTQEDNQDDPVSTASDDTMNQPISGPSSSPGEPVEEHLEDSTSPTLDQKPTKEQVELLLLALKLKHGLTNRALEDIMHLINFSAGPGGELVSRSKYLFYKAFDSVKDILEVHYVCKSCNVSMQEDYMHSVILGVARSITTLWFHSEYNQSPWYIGRSTEQIDDILTSIKPPCNVPPIPCSVKEKKFWKTHEWNMWLFYYSILYQH
ncbi:uncharacterized protein LOC132849288 [Tachysurus vachellii]|uniref:uncharacterized protein LOC132849288 n=1 Tax=Tachysurus vachellii TaxID=175792 RepID=UPI00296B0F14|nr:uncharacterized protein LOC132849288 [Tachysurus vachellii]